MRAVTHVCVWLTLGHLAFGVHRYESEEVGTLAGDVQNWAILLQNYILQVRECYDLPGYILLYVYMYVCTPRPLNIYTYAHNRHAHRHPQKQRERERD